MAGLLNRLRGSSSSIEADLKRITDTEAIDVPKDALMNIVQASHSVDDRREIMQHLRECLSEPSEKRWRRIYGGLVLVEQLLQRGSRALMVETSEGLHFDLVQRLSFLEHFSFKTDIRVQGMVRQKAQVLRGEVISRIQNPSDAPQLSISAEDAAISLSPNGTREDANSDALFLPISTGSQAAGDGAKTPVIVNGLVSVGHRDDTTSESSGAEDNGRRPVAKQQQQQPQEKRRTKTVGSGTFKDFEAHRRNVLDDSTDSDSGSDARERRKKEREQRQKAKPTSNGTSPVAPAAQSVDLLGM
jgi:hypothetical protein